MLGSHQRAGAAMTNPIGYVDSTWNPMHGCSPVDESCAHCWAAIMAKRLAGSRTPTYDPDAPFKVTFNPAALKRLPKKPQRIAVNFMGDMFHDAHDLQDILSVISTMRAYQQHTYIMLTKRPANMARIADLIGGFRANEWCGVSACNQRTWDERTYWLGQVNAAVRWVSIEPMLGPIVPSALDLQRISWVVLGGENGPGARPMQPDWVRAVRDACAAAGVPFWFKGWGKHHPLDDPMRSRCGEDDEFCARAIDRSNCARCLDGREHNGLPAQPEGRG